MAWLSLLREPQAENNVSLVEFSLSVPSWVKKKFAFKLILVGRTQLFVVGELWSLFPCWLSGVVLSSLEALQVFPPS